MVNRFEEYKQKANRIFEEPKRLTYWEAIGLILNKKFREVKDLEGQEKVAAIEGIVQSAIDNLNRKMSEDDYNRLVDKLSKELVIQRDANKEYEAIDDLEYKVNDAIKYLNNHVASATNWLKYFNIIGFQGEQGNGSHIKLEDDNKIRITIVLQRESSNTYQKLQEKMPNNYLCALACLIRQQEKGKNPFKECTNCPAKNCKNRKL